MTLQEMQSRLKKSTIETEEQLQSITTLYILLDLHKDDFCKIVDVVGLGKLLNKQNHYDRLARAEEELTAKERYLKAVYELEELEDEKIRLQEIVQCYSPLK